MQVSDLVTIGKLGKSIDRDGYVTFKQYRNFRLPFLKDVFLLFTDNRVRYVTVTEIDTRTSIKLKIDDQDTLAEAVLDGNVAVLMPPSEIDLMRQERQADFSGKQVFFRDALLGYVSASFHNGAQEVIIIHLEEGREILVPMVEAYVSSIGKKRIILKDIEGFLDL